jgi:hypothetical protein
MRVCYGRSVRTVDTGSPRRLLISRDADHQDRGTSKQIELRPSRPRLTRPLSSAAREKGENFACASAGHPGEQLYHVTVDCESDPLIALQRHQRLQ